MPQTAQHIFLNQRTRPQARKRSPIPRDPAAQDDRLDPGRVQRFGPGEQRVGPGQLARRGGGVAGGFQPFGLRAELLGLHNQLQRLSALGAGSALSQADLEPQSLAESTPHFLGQFVADIEPLGHCPFQGEAVDDRLAGGVDQRHADGQPLFGPRDAAFDQRAHAQRPHQAVQRHVRLPVGLHAASGDHVQRLDLRQLVDQSAGERARQVPQVLGLAVILEVENGDARGIERDILSSPTALPTSSGEHEGQHRADRHHVHRDADLLDPGPRLATLLTVQVGQHQNRRDHTDPDGEADVGHGRRQAVAADQPILELQHPPADGQVDAEDLRYSAPDQLLKNVDLRVDGGP